MPLLAPAVGEIVTPGPPPPDPPPPPRTYITWTPNGGTERVLIWPASIAVRVGALGVDMPPESYFESALAVSDGAILQSRRTLPREVTLPLLFWNAYSVQQLEDQRRELIRDFDPRLGDGTLTWATPDGGVRTLACRYVSGLESQTNGRLQPAPIAEYDVVLRAVDPYWYGNQQTVTIKAPSGLPLLPGPPFAISEDTAFGTTTVTIDGEVETYPEWLITGPATAATLSNIGTGKTLSLTPALSSGQTLLVRTEPRVLASQKFTNTAGSNVWASVAGQFPVLWSLQPGTNQVDITLTGTSAASEVRMTYRPRYLTA